MSTTFRKRSFAAIAIATAIAGLVSTDIGVPTSQTIVNQQYSPMSQTVVLRELHTFRTATSDMANDIQNRTFDTMTTGSVAKRTNSAGKKGKKRRGMFGSVAIPFASISAAGRWRETKHAMKQGSSFKCGSSKSCQKRKSKVEKIVSESENLSFFKRLNRVNSAVNSLISYRSDLSTYGKKDHWALPAESIKAGIGDCEDYVILKMALLRQLNVPERSMSLVVLKDTTRNLYHAVLAVSTNKGIFILDNVQSRVLLDRQLPHYLPLYSFSGSRSWIHGWKKSQRRQLALAKNLDLASALPGESYAAPLVDETKIAFLNLAELRPSTLPSPGYRDEQASIHQQYALNSHWSQPSSKPEGSPR